MAETDNAQVKSKRELALERLASKYPEKTYNDDEELFGQINDDYDEYDNQLKGYKEREGKMVDMFTSDPRSAQFLVAWRNGEDPVVNLVRNFGTDIKEAIDDPARLEQIAEANKEFLDKMAEEKELDDEYKSNLKASLEQLEKLQAEKGLTDDQVDEAMAFVVTIVKDGVMGKFTPETIEMAMKAVNHDADVETAAHEAEVRGRNAKITENLRTRKANDGTAQLDGKNSGTSFNAQPNLGALNNYGDGSRDIWDRGGMTRKKAQQA